MKQHEPCESMQSNLFRVVEGEANPRQAMATALHLSECTACRIVLARERRLAAMLEQELDDPLSVGEEFVRDVMASLPETAPRVASKPQRRGKRSIKLALLIGAMVSSLRAIGSLDGVDPLPAGLFSMPELRVEHADSAIAALAGLIRLVTASTEGLLSRLPQINEWVGAAPALGASMALTALASFVAGATAIAWISRGLHRAA